MSINRFYCLRIVYDIKILSKNYVYSIVTTSILLGILQQ